MTGLAAANRCIDTTSYLDETWRAPTITLQLLANASALTASTTLLHPAALIAGLAAGTTYQCSLGAANAVGGFGVPFEAMWPAFSTLPVAPSPIDPSSMACEYAYSVVKPGSGLGAPGRGEVPTVGLQVVWRVPRPNDVGLSLSGPTQYNFTGPQGVAVVNASSVISSAALTVNNGAHYLQATPPTPSTAAAFPYEYATNYSFHIRGEGTSGSGGPSSSMQCSTPDFRPGPPNLTSASVFDRSVVVTWSAPALLNCDPATCAVDQYLYQLCKGHNCTFDVGNKYDSWMRKRFMCRDGQALECGYGGCDECEVGDHAQTGTPFTIRDFSDAEGLLPATEYTLILRARTRCFGGCEDGYWGGKLPGSVRPNGRVIQGPNRLGLGFASARFTFKTKPVPLPPLITTYGGRSISLEWPAYAVDGILASGYTVTMSSTNQTGLPVVREMSTGLQRSATFTSLTPGAHVAFTVRATVDGIEGGESDPLTISLGPDVPNAPASAPILNPLRSHSALLQWEPAHDNVRAALKRSPTTLMSQRQ